jgi:hypothetical protein
LGGIHNFLSLGIFFSYIISNRPTFPTFIDIFSAFRAFRYVHTCVNALHHRYGWATSVDSDQPAHPYHLIWIYNFSFIYLFY